MVLESFQCFVVRKYLHMKIRIPIIFIITTLWVSFLSADSLLDSFLERIKKVKTFQVDFEQRNYWPEMEIEKISYGKLVTKKSNIRLEYSNPNNQLMVGNENELIFYFPEEKQAIIQNANYWQSLLSPELLSKKYLSYCNLDSTFVSKDSYIFKFSTNKEMDDFSEIVIQFSKSDSLITFFEYKDKYDNVVGFKFSNHIINQAVSDSLFSFEIPDSINVLDQRILKGDKDIGE